MELELFKDKNTGPHEPPRPLADRMRPGTLGEFFGQRHLVGTGKYLQLAVERKELPSLILWGPPGTGKTTLAFILARAADAEVVAFSAVTAGVKDVRDVIKEAAGRLRTGKKTVLFVDEIHRFNKAQQDAFLHTVEDGTITLIGATTENPSFEVISALLSRCKVLLLEPLSEDEIKDILIRAMADRERGLGAMPAKVDDDVPAIISANAHGDARWALNAIEASFMVADKDPSGARLVTREVVMEAMQRKSIVYDRAGEEHYNVISAFIKSMRGSDPDAALYWLARMIEAGEDPLFIARRMVIFASEDIGNADPQALSVALGVKDAAHFVGMPEGWIPLAHGVAYLSTAPKSNASYAAYLEALEDVKAKGALPSPLHIRNAPTRLMKDLGYSKGYRYPHEYEDGFVREDYLPDALKGRVYYKPTDRGHEKTIRERMDALRKKHKDEG